MDFSQPKVAPFSIGSRGGFVGRGAPRLASSGFGSIGKYQRGGAGKKHGTRSRSRSPHERRSRRRRSSSGSSENSTETSPSSRNRKRGSSKKESSPNFGGNANCIPLGTKKGRGKSSLLQAAGTLSQLGSNKGLKTSKNRDLLNSKMLGGLGRGERRGKARGLGRGRGLNREDASESQEGIGEVLPIT